MFDLTRLTELVGDVIGQQVAGGGMHGIMENLGAHGIDMSQLEGLDAGEFISLLAENGIELSQLDSGQLSQLVDQLGIELPVGDIVHPFAGLPERE